MALPFPTILVLSLLLVASTVPLAHGLTLDGSLITRAEINGRVFCSTSGNPEPGSSNSTGAVGANVGLVCDGNQTIIAGATTDVNGFFQITVDAPLLQTITNITNCEVVVNLPIVSCVLTPIVGQLVAVITLVDVVTGTVLGAVARFAIGLLQFVV